jgi:oxygen-dependent protoporphyrinogen oxidase
VKIVVVGGGIAGTAAAYFLRRHRPILIEARDRLGGVIATHQEGGFLIEGGPDSFITAKPWAEELCRELKLELIPMKQRGAYLLDGGRLRRLPENFMQPGAWLRGGPLSTGGRLRMLLGALESRGGEDDESIGGFVRRVWGEEMVEKFAEPLLAGIYMAPADRLSLESTFPALRLASTFGVRDSEGSPFVSIRGGMERLIEALRAPEVEYRTGTAVGSLDEIDADRIILATPAPVTAKLLGLEDATPYVSSSVVTLGFSGVALPEGTGFVVLRAEGQHLTACSFSSNKFEGRAPPGCALVRCFFHGDGSVDLARAELREILGLEAEPVVTRVFRWPDANPVYEVGHQQRVARIESKLPPRVILTGAGWHGIGLPDCIRDARRAADAAVRDV